VDPLYIIRIDDACPTNNLEKWDYLESLLDKFKIKPIVCVIPDNKDRQLLRNGSFDHHFWDRVHRWVCKDWLVALHGSTHEYTTDKKGLVPLNNYSEFAGVPISIQREKIRKGYNILLENGIKSKIWVAPAHTFDKNTLKVLRDETDIRVISDGLAMYPYNQYGFFWIPQQMWGFKKKEKGVWTICLHPDVTDSAFIDDLFDSVGENKSHFDFSYSDLERLYSSRQLQPNDYIFKIKFLIKKRYDHLYVNNKVFHSAAEVMKKILK
jgi:predicted deacetylase